MSERVNIEHLDDRIAYFRNKRIRTSDEWCPRCGQKRVSKNMRMCLNCRGVLLWQDIDDGKFAQENMDDFYVWSNVNGLKAWRHSSYWTITNLHREWNKKPVGMK